MLFKNTQTLLYLSSNSLKLFSLRGREDSLDIPPTVVNNFEIVDYNDLEKKIVSFLAKNGLINKNTILILSDEFESDNPHIENLYQSVGDIINRINSRLKAIVLISKFNHLESTDTIRESDVKKILNQGSVIKRNNLFHESKVAPVVEQRHNTSSFPVGTFITVFLIILLLIGGLIAFLNFGDKLPKFNSENIKTEIPTREPLAISTNAPTSSSSATQSADPITTKSVEDLTAEILNGSGVSGQAASIRKELDAIGIGTIQVGNISRSDQTTITYSDNVSKNIQTQIKNLVEEISETTAVVESTTSARYDIQISTGE